MQLIFFILVLSCYVQNSVTIPPPPGTEWRRSRYIIDNRRNALFSKKLPTGLSQDDPPKEAYGFGQTLYPVERYQKDLTAEASISEPKFYGKYGENSLPKKIIKSYRLTGGYENPPYVGIFENQKNTSEVLDPQNFIQNEDEVGNDVTSKVVTTTEKTLTWVPKLTSSTTSKDPQKSSESTNQGFEYGIPTTASYPWDIAKTEQGNQIDSTNEKHVYETRIETVSYHQEVIFNPPKKQNWYQENRQEPKNYEQPEKNYEQPEQNYEQPEQNYEQPEQNYEQPEQNYEQPEQNYEQPEQSYEQPEQNYEQPEQNYEQSKKSYEDMEKMQPTGSEDNQNKFGYVVEGTNYRKYRVEERTVDGFIVGEYGVVSHDDGSLRGVRYTADGNTNPKLIYETLIKFLSL